MIDTYTKVILTIIAIALVMLVARTFDAPLIAKAQASDAVCQIKGPVEVRVERMPDWPAGTWSGKPIFIKETN